MKRPLQTILLLAGLCLVPPSAGSQDAGSHEHDAGSHEPAVEQGSGDAEAVLDGPIRRRPPVQVPPRPEPVPDMPETAGAPEETDAVDPAAAAAGRPVVEVLDASVFDGVFAPYVVRDGREIPTSLTGEPGDPVAGRRLFHNFSRTGCSLCHDTAEAPRPADSDRTAPPLYRVGERLTTAHLRLWIVAPETIDPGAAMPAFHRPGQRTDPWDPLYGGPLLTAAEVEDLVAYLATAGMPSAGH